MSIVIIKHMARPANKLEYRYCKLCYKEIHYKLYRKVNTLKKGPRKVNLLAGQILTMERDFRSAIIVKNLDFTRDIEKIQYLN